jgi:histidyl-tRNA synthetase
MIKTQTLKGFRDFLPKDVRKREFVLNTLRQVFETFGFEPLETPTLEYEEILTGKYGNEGDKLMYRFEDNGKRKVAMRYDQTVPLARVISQYQNDLQLPFKRYQIQNVWRAENTQKGRYREFLQVDADIVGAYSPLADAEIVILTALCLEKLGFKNFTIWVNDRNNFKGFPDKAIAIVDKLKKIGTTEVQEELRKNNLNENLISDIKNKPASKKIEEIIELVYKLNNLLEDKIKYDATLARGLDYYTGIIFEVEVEGYPTGSIAGGGRYDNLIGMFAGRDIPAVGIAFGFDRIIESMEELNLFPNDLRTNLVFVAFSNPDLMEKAVKITTELRNNIINTEFYFEDISLEKQIKYADKKGIPFVIIVEENNLILKDMEKRTQETLSLEEIIKKLQ